MNEVCDKALNSVSLVHNDTLDAKVGDIDVDIQFGFPLVTSLSRLACVNWLRSRRRLVNWRCNSMVRHLNLVVPLQSGLIDVVLSVGLNLILSLLERIANRFLLILVRMLVLQLLVSLRLLLVLLIRLNCGNMDKVVLRMHATILWDPHRIVVYVNHLIVGQTISHHPHAFVLLLSLVQLLSIDPLAIEEAHRLVLSSLNQNLRMESLRDNWRWVAKCRLESALLD